MKFYNREKEMEWFRKHFATEPNSILFIHGPKHCGKTALIRHFLENEIDRTQYWINYLNLKEISFPCQSSLIEAFFERIMGFEIHDIPSRQIGEKDFIRHLFTEDEKTYVPFPGEIIMEAMRERRAKNKTPIIVLDEAQFFKTIFEGEDKRGVVTLLQFLSYLSKTQHISHCVLLMNDSFFLQTLHQEASLHFSTELMFIDHLDENSVTEWMKDLFQPDEINLLWERLGGNQHALAEAIHIREKGQNLQAFLEYFDSEVSAKIQHFYYWQLDNEAQKSIFRQFAKELYQRDSLSIWDEKMTFLHLPQSSVVLRKLCDFGLTYYCQSKSEIFVLNKTTKRGITRFIQNLNMATTSFDKYE